MIGKRKQIQLKKYISVKDVKGDAKESVSETINTWAEVSRSSGDRSSLNGKEGLTNFFIFRMRFNGEIDPTGNWRVVYDRRTFTVHSIEKEKQKRFYWIIKAESKGER
jgi:SPP1 family predicted phage head-tail adaptor